MSRRSMKEVSNQSRAKEEGLIKLISQICLKSKEKVLREEESDMTTSTIWPENRLTGISGQN